MTDQAHHRKPTAEERQALNATIKRANEGDPRALERLRVWLDQNPQVWSHLGDLARVAEGAWIKVIAGGDTLTAESLRRQLKQLNDDLVGEEPSAVERMLADSVLATWLEVKYMEAATAEGTGGSKTQAGHFLRRLESAQKRHLTAIKSLVQTRKLLPKSGAVPDLRVFRGESA